MGSEQIPQPLSTAAMPHRPAAQKTSVAGTAHRWLLDRIGDLWALLTERPISLYAASVLRIGYGLLYLVFLLREFPHRDEIWGPGSPGRRRWHSSSSTRRAGTASCSCPTAAPTSNSAM